MQSRKFRILLVGALGVLAALAFPPLRAAFAANAPSAQPLYTNDFEKASEGDPPKDVAILNGTFAVKTVDGNKLLELPGDPVDSFGVLFGPDGESHLCVQARLYGTATGKRMPEFGVGLGDSNGYKLWLMPATGQLQILKGEDVVATVPHAWKSGSWTVMKLEAKAADGKTLVQGKAWAQGADEPKDWTIKFEDKDEAPKGRASVWGSPYSSTPIRFDDLVVTKAE
jgi:hypothetical protein